MIENENALFHLFLFILLLIFHLPQNLYPTIPHLKLHSQQLD